MTDLYPFVQGSMEWPFSELFFTDVSLWNQYKYIAFNFFSYLYKMLIITVISNEKTCRNVTIFHRQKLASLFQVQEKLKACKNFK